MLCGTAQYKTTIIIVKTGEFCKAMCLHKSCIVSKRVVRLMVPRVAVITPSPNHPVPSCSIMYVHHTTAGSGIFYSYNFKNVIMYNQAQSI